MLHCAARSLVGQTIADPSKYYRDNVAGGVALLEAARAAGVGRIVFWSTAAVYGVPTPRPIPEDAPLARSTPTARRNGRSRGRCAGTAAYGLRSVILRYFNVAGATERLGEVHRPETHLIPNSCWRPTGGPALTLFGDDYPTPDGTPIRDYIHALGPRRRAPGGARATEPADPRTGPVFEALTPRLGRGFRVQDVLRAAETVVGHPIPHTIGPAGGRSPILVASNHLAAARSSAGARGASCRR